MKSFFLPVLFASLLTPVMSDDGIEFSESTPAVGWAYEVRFENSVEIAERVTGPDGTVVHEEEETVHLAYHCLVRVLGVTGGQATSLSLAFTHARMTDAQGEHDPGLDGHTVLAEGVSGSRTFGVEEGDLNEIQSDFLELAFNSAGDDDIATPEAYLPAKAVAVGESWELSPDLLLGVLGDLEIDPAQSTSTATLEEVSEESNGRYGHVRIEATLHPVADDSVGGKIEVKGLLVRSIDGSEPFGSFDLKVGAGLQGKIEDPTDAGGFQFENRLLGTWSDQRSRPKE